jgi:hypothetical protein
VPPVATCTDDTDTSCSVVVDVSGVDTSTAGSYEIIYQSTDTAGNTTEVTVVVTVEEIPVPQVSVTISGTPTVSEIITDTGVTVVASLGSVIEPLIIMLSVENGSLSKMEIESVAGQVISESVDVFDLQGGLFGQYSINITWL